MGSAFNSRAQLIDTHRKTGIRRRGASRPAVAPTVLPGTSAIYPSLQTICPRLGRNERFVQRPGRAGRFVFRRSLAGNQAVAADERSNLDHSPSKKPIFVKSCLVRASASIIVRERTAGLSRRE